MQLAVCIEGSHSKSALAGLSNHTGGIDLRVSSGAVAETEPPDPMSQQAGMLSALAPTAQSMDLHLNASPCGIHDSPLEPTRRTALSGVATPGANFEDTL